MTLVDVIGSQPGRVLWIAAGAGIITAGVRRGDARGHVLAVAGLAPLAAALPDVCVLGPLVHGPLHGESFRQYRRAR